MGFSARYGEGSSSLPLVKLGSRPSVSYIVECLMMTLNLHYIAERTLNSHSLILLVLQVGGLNIFTYLSLVMRYWPNGKVVDLQSTLRGFNSHIPLELLDFGTRLITWAERSAIPRGGLFN